MPTLRLRAVLLTLIGVAVFLLFTEISQLQSQTASCDCPAPNCPESFLNLEEEEIEEEFGQIPEERLPAVDEEEVEDPKEQNSLEVPLDSEKQPAPTNNRNVTNGLVEAVSIPRTALDMFNQLQGSNQQFLNTVRNFTSIISNVDTNPFKTFNYYEVWQASSMRCEDLVQIGVQMHQQWTQMVADYDYKASRLPLKSITDLLQFAAARHVPYRLYVGHDCPNQIRTKLSDAERDLNILIPVSGRLRNIRPCCTYLHAAAATVSETITVKITLIEIGDKPEAEELVADIEDVDYIFLPSSIANISGCGPLFAKGLGYNLGFKLTRHAPWTLFHDIDIVVPLSFFDQFSNKFKSYKVPWFFPYTILKVMSEQVTNQFIEDFEQNNEKSLQAYTTKKSVGTNPGGSVFIRSDIFVDVGGYDPEMFWGWAPEDQFMMRKLQFYTNYFRREPVVLYHMFHPTTTKHRYDTLFHGISHFFNNSMLYDKYWFLNFKRHLFLN